ncbi:OsmC family protein [Bacillota bacterium Lsc_1132]
MKFNLSETGAFQTEFEFGKLSISGNSDIGFKPVQLMVSSIAGCSGGVFKKILEKKRIAYKGIEITASVERNPDEANRITKISFHYIVDGENLNLQQLEKSLEVAFKNCAMAQSVKGAIEIVETVSIKVQG